MSATTRPRARIAKAKGRVMAKVARRRKKAAPARVRRRAPLPIVQLIRQHPVATAAVAVSAGALLFAALTLLPRLPARKGTRTLLRVPQRNLLPRPAPARTRTHDVGAAEMEFNARRPGRKDIMFRFAWKKRPVDAPETDWPTDHMGFVLKQRGGRHTAFRLVRKTRPRPSWELLSARDDARPGLGRAQMEFVAKRANGRDFRFVWNKVPPGEAPAAPPALVHKAG